MNIIALFIRLWYGNIEMNQNKSEYVPCFSRPVAIFLILDCQTPGYGNIEMNQNKSEYVPCG